MKKQKWPWKFCEFVSVKLIFLPVKIWKKCARESRKSVREKNHNCVWEIYQYIQFQDQVLMIVTILIKILAKLVPVKKTPTREKKRKFCPWNEIFYPWKNTKIVPVKKKVCVKKTEKSVREKHFLPVKKSKKRKKTVFTGTFFFHGEKK